MTNSIRRTSHSEVESFLSCERRHYYAYGLQIQGKYTSEALERGIMVHHALAIFYQGLKDNLSVDAAQSKAIMALSDLYSTSSAYDPTKLFTGCMSLFNWYIDFYRDEFQHIEVLEVETDYLIPITDDYSLPVKIDLIYRDLRVNEVVVTDHKIVADFYDLDKVELLPQLPKYLAGLRTKGIKVDRAEYNMLRHRNTLDNKADPGLRFRRLDVPLTKARILRTIEEQIRTANRIKSLRDRGIEEWSKTVLRNTGSCGNCSFKLLCSAELNGKPINDLIEFEFKPRTRRVEMNN